MSASVAYGRIDITGDAEGFDWPEDRGFHYGFGIRRNPRTLAGVRPDGTLLLVIVEGSGPGYSVGATFGESAELMRSLGAEEALNLDGGGSTTPTAGERPIGAAPADERRQPRLRARRIAQVVAVISGSESKGAY